MQSKRRIIIGSDHAGYTAKAKVIDFLTKAGYQIEDVGPFSEESVDYPDYAHKVAHAVNDAVFDTGILICGSGNGVCMTANKYSKVRAALAWNAEIASLSRQHNNANILCMPARFITENEIIKITEIFLTVKFEGGRHENRINKIPITSKA